MSTENGRTKTSIAGNIATVLFIVVIILQLLIAVGIVPISMAWGGRRTELTPGLRAASVTAAAILATFTYVIRRRAGLSGDGTPSRLIKILSWVITAFLAFNTLGNIASRSSGERLLFGPVTFVLTLSCLVVSLSKPQDLPDERTT